MDQIRQIIRQELARLLGEGAGASPPTTWGGVQAAAPQATGEQPPTSAAPAYFPATQPPGGAAPAVTPGMAAPAGGMAGMAAPAGDIQKGGKDHQNLQEEYRELTQAMSQNLQKLQFVLQETSEITRKVEQLLWEASRAEQKLKRGR